MNTLRGFLVLPVWVAFVAAITLWAIAATAAVLAVILASVAVTLLIACLGIPILALAALIQWILP